MDKDEAVLVQSRVVFDCDSSYLDKDEFKRPGPDENFSVLYFQRKDSYSDIYFEKIYGKIITQ